MGAATKVYLRGDGHAAIGLGHVHRLLALADMLRGTFECEFAIRSPLPGLRALILESCHGVIDLGNLSVEEELNVLTDMFHGDEIIVLDGYTFQTEYQARLKGKGSALICIDDLQSYPFVADVVINPAGGVDPSLYVRESYTQILTGPRHAFLKPPFLEAARNRMPRTGKSSLLICMGGADPDNHTLATLKECIGHDFERLYIIIGEAYRHKAELFETAETFGDKVEILTNLDPAAMAAIMKKCGAAICSASGVAYEYASVGGELYIRQTAANQTLLYYYLIGAGLAFPVEELRVGAARVRTVEAKQADVFDGKSGVRIQKIFNRIDFARHSRIRQANQEDLLMVFRWVNDPELRKQSYSVEPIPLEDHTKWFLSKLADPASSMYLVEYKGEPVAQIRFDVRGKEAIISYSMEAGYRGRGWGQSVLEWGIAAFRKAHSQPVKIVGYVKTVNQGSVTIFESLGFNRQETNDYPNSYKFELNVS